MNDTFKDDLPSNGGMGILGMNLKEIKLAIDQGKKVFWSNPNYQVIKDSKGQYLIVCSLNDSCIGLTWKDGITLNGKKKDFHILLKDENHELEI